MRYIKILCTLFLCISILDISSQTDTNDFNSWFIAGLEYDASDKFRIGFETQLRLKEDASVVDEYFGELNMMYKLPANFRLGTGFRYIRENDNRGNIQGYENHFRYHVDISFRHKFDRFGLLYRVRYQNKNELNISKDDGDIHREAIRLKARFNYNFKKWKLDPVLSGELFNRFRQGNSENGFNKYRLSIGSNYKFKKVGNIGLSYLFEKEFDVLNPRSFHILKLSYIFKIKGK